MLNDTVVAISGGCGRLGMAFSNAILKNGGRIVLGDINKESGLNFVKEFGPTRAVFFHGDLTKKGELEKFIQKGKQQFGKVDVALHCAYPRSKKWGAKFEDLDSIYLKEDLNNQLGGAIIFSQKFIKHFCDQGHGHLIHISSIQGIGAPKFEHYKGTKMESPIEYSAIKAGIINITLWLAKRYSKKNIRVNCISPGGILDNQPKEFLKKYKQSCNSKGMLEADDVTGALIFLISDNSKFVNGQNIVIDDGWSL